MRSSWPNGKLACHQPSRSMTQTTQPTIPFTGALLGNSIAELKGASRPPCDPAPSPSGALEIESPKLGTQDGAQSGGAAAYSAWVGRRYLEFRGPWISVAPQDFLTPMLQRDKTPLVVAHKGSINAA